MPEQENGKGNKVSDVTAWSQSDVIVGNDTHKRTGEMLPRTPTPGLCIGKAPKNQRIREQRDLCAHLGQLFTN